MEHYLRCISLDFHFTGYIDKCTAWEWNCYIQDIRPSLAIHIAKYMIR